MGSGRSIVAALAAVLLLGTAPAVLAKDLHGVALVIGESDYHSDALRDLDNPRNDARALDDLLSELGFDVDRVLDKDAARLRSSIDTFVDDAAKADVALVYYSGHGIEAGGEDYLVPTDADLSTPAKAGESLVPLKGLLDRLAKTVPVTIVLLDACRTNAFPAGTTVVLPGGTQVIDVATTGLGEVRGPTPVASSATPADSLGMVIGFAASPGQAALDGDPGGNSPYAAALLKHLGAGGYSFGDVMTMVSEEVYLKTNAKQLPWTNTSLRRVLNFGAVQTEGDPDEAAIADGRRRLLLSIAKTPASDRQEVEAAAQAGQVPMDALYGMLAALGADAPNDPEALRDALAKQTERLKKIMSEQTTLTSTDPEIVRLSGLAQRALAEGALDANVALWERAKERFLQISATLDETETNLKARRLEGGLVLARTAEAHELRGDFLPAADDYRAAFEQVSRWDRSMAFYYKSQEAAMLWREGDARANSAVLERSIEAYGNALDLAGSPAEVLAIRGNLGTVLSSLGDHETSDLHLQQAIEVFREVQAGRAIDREGNWSMTQDALGNALLRLGQRQANIDLLTEAVNAFRTALDAEIGGSSPTEVARIRSNLAGAITSLASREDNAELFKEAIQGYRDAIAASDRQRNPRGWARTMNGLGDALESLGELLDSQSELSEAVSSYQTALVELTEERYPLDFAMVQNNLGNALRELGDRRGDAAQLSLATEAFEKAAAASKNTDPVMWFQIQDNLGNAFADLGDLEAGTDALRKALVAYDEALSRIPADTAPVEWANIQTNKGTVLRALGTKTGELSWTEQAVAAHRLALTALDPRGTPAQWASTQVNLAIALTDIGDKKSDAATLGDAVSAYEAAILTRTRTSDPLGWARCKNSLGGLLVAIGQFTNDRAVAMRGRDAIEEAFAVFKASGDTSDYFATRLETVDSILESIAPKN